jgi:HK97 family phage prohead protease
MPENEIEQRFITDPVQASTADDGSMHIKGMGIVFDQRSSVLVNSLGSFVEEIDPAAVDEILPFSDVRGRFDHNVVLGRTKSGTLKLEKGARGISYDITINPDDPEGMAAYAKVKRGDVDGSSFMFTVPKGGDQWRREDGMAVRRVTKISSLLDIGPVAYPAYPQTSAAVRSQLETFQQEETTPPVQAASSGAEEQVKARQAARSRTLYLLSAK